MGERSLRLNRSERQPGAELSNIDKSRLKQKAKLFETLSPSVSSSKETLRALRILYNTKNDKRA